MFKKKVVLSWSLFCFSTLASSNSRLVQRRSGSSTGVGVFYHYIRTNRGKNEYIENIFHITKEENQSNAPSSIEAPSSGKTFLSLFMKDKNSASQLLFPLSKIKNQKSLLPTPLLYEPLLPVNLKFSGNRANSSLVPSGAAEKQQLFESHLKKIKQLKKYLTE